MHRLLLILQLHFLQLVREITVLSTSSNLHQILICIEDYGNFWDVKIDSFFAIFSSQNLFTIICLTLILMTEFPSRKSPLPLQLLLQLFPIAALKLKSKAEAKHHHSKLQLSTPPVHIYPSRPEMSTLQNSSRASSVGFGQCPEGATKAPLFILFIAIVCLLHNSMAFPFLSLVRRFLRSSTLNTDWQCSSPFYRSANNSASTSLGSCKLFMRILFYDVD